MAHQYIVRTDQPFNGTTQSLLLEDGTVAYTGGLTLEAYQAERGYPVRVLDRAELEQMLADYEAGCVTEPEEETEEQWWYALEVLPPCRWGHTAGVELFHVSERLFGDLVHWHAAYRGRWWTFVDQARRDPAELAAKVKAAAQ